MMRAEHDPDGLNGLEGRARQSHEDSSVGGPRDAQSARQERRRNGLRRHLGGEGLSAALPRPGDRGQHRGFGLPHRGSDESSAAAFRYISRVTVADQGQYAATNRLVLAQILNRLTERLEYRDGRAIAGYRHRLLLMIDEFPSLGRLDMFAESLSLIAGYGIKACLIAQDISQIHAPTAMTRRSRRTATPASLSRRTGIETARLLSQMAGEATVRHAHQTISSSRARVVSEPEVARPLLTPDEAMHLETPRSVDLRQRTAGDSRHQDPATTASRFSSDSASDSSRRRKAIVSRTQLPSGRPRAQ